MRLIADLPRRCRRSIRLLKSNDPKRHKASDAGLTGGVEPAMVDVECGRACQADRGVSTEAAV